MDESEEYKFDICPQCMWRAGDLMPMCEICEDGEQFEEAEFADDEEPYLTTRRVIPILETT